MDSGDRMPRGPFRHAYRKGREAAAKGLPLNACPYEDKRAAYRNSKTYSIAWIKAWESGWRSVASR